MTAKEYLSQIEILNIKINRRLKEIEELKDMAVALQGIDYAKDKVQTLPCDALSDRVIKALDLQEECKDMIRDMQQLKHKIIGQIHELDKGIEISTLEKHYIDGMSLGKIAEETHYDYHYICTVHGIALQNFYNKHLNFS